MPRTVTDGKRTSLLARCIRPLRDRSVVSRRLCKGAGRERKIETRFPRSLGSRSSTRDHPHTAALRCGGHGHGRDDPCDRGLRVGGLEPAPGRPLAPRAADDPGQPRARRAARGGGRGGARQHVDRRQPRDHDRTRVGSCDVAPGGSALRGSARRGERDPPAARDPPQRAGNRRHRGSLPRNRRGVRRERPRDRGRARPTSPS